MNLSLRYPHAPPGRIFQLVHGIARLLVWTLSRTAFQGESHIPPLGPVLLAGNHISIADPFVFVSIAGCRRPIHMLVAAGLFRIPLLGTLLRSLEFIPVQRHTALAGEALTPALEVLQRGGVVALYPEGEISRDPALWPVRFHTGVIRLALDSGAPVVPLVQWGTADVVGPKHRRRSSWRRVLARPTIQVRVLPSLDMRALLGVSSAECDIKTLRRGADLLTACMLEALVQMRGEHPPATAGIQRNPPR